MFINLGYTVQDITNKTVAFEIQISRAVLQ